MYSGRLSMSMAREYAVQAFSQYCSADILGFFGFAAFTQAPASRPMSPRLFQEKASSGFTRVTSSASS